MHPKRPNGWSITTEPREGPEGKTGRLASHALVSSLLLAAPCVSWQQQHQNHERDTLRKRATHFLSFTAVSFIFYCFRHYTQSHTHTFSFFIAVSINSTELTLYLRLSAQRERESIICAVMHPFLLLVPGLGCLAGLLREISFSFSLFFLAFLKMNLHRRNGANKVRQRYRWF